MKLSGREQKQENRRIEKFCFRLTDPFDRAGDVETCRSVACDRVVAEADDLTPLLASLSAA